MSKRKGPEPAKMHDAGDRIVMDISIEEAMLLEVVLCHVGGHEYNSPRQYSDTLLNALRELGFSHSHEETHKFLSGPGVHFREKNITHLVKWDRKAE